MVEDTPKTGSIEVKKDENYRTYYTDGTNFTRALNDIKLIFYSTHPVILEQKKKMKDGDLMLLVEPRAQEIRLQAEIIMSYGQLKRLIDMLNDQWKIIEEDIQKKKEEIINE
jgi:hypothetical protein